MKTLFPGFYPLTDSQLTTLWSEGTIVPDANVLLNLYRYPETAQKELLELLDSVKSRLWLPYHAALEFHRNRLNVIAEQKRRFNEVKELAQKTRNTFKAEISKLRLSERHALINPASIISEIDAAVEKFVQEIDSLELDHMDVNKPDAVRSALVTIFEGRVGPPPDQRYVDRVSADANQRFPARMPPGYMDAEKDKGSDPMFFHSGVRYERKLGDLIVWNQIIDFAKDTKPHGIMFVTDDEKEDWWNIVSSSGNKTIGPRPELFEEANRLAGLELFHVLKSSGFMIQSKVHLRSRVSDSTIKQVEAIARNANTQRIASPTQSEAAIIRWLEEQNPGWEVEETLVPDLTLKSPNGKRLMGFEVIRPERDSDIESIYKSKLDILSLVKNPAVERLDVVAVVPDLESSKNESQKLSMMECEPGIGLVVGHLDHNGDVPRFVPTLRLSG